MAISLELAPQEPKLRWSVISTRATKRSKACHEGRLDVILSGRFAGQQSMMRFPCIIYEQRVLAALSKCDRVRALSTLVALQVRTEVFASVSTGGRSGAYIHDLTLAVRIAFGAHRAVGIPSEEQVRGWVDQPLIAQIVQHMREGCDFVIAEVANREALSSRVTQANSLLEHLANDVRKKAREIVGYEQRLAALTAEYEEEKQVQVARVSVEILAEEDPQFSDGTPIDPRCVVAATKVLADWCKGGDGPFGRASTSLVSPIREVDVK